MKAFEIAYETSIDAETHAVISEMAEAESKIESTDDFGDEGPDSSFKAPDKVDLTTILAKDAEDPALARYKASLLGQAAQASVLAADTEMRRVVIHELRIMVTGRPDIVLPLDTADNIRAVEANRLVVKEGLSFSTKLIFSIHREVCLGLRFSQKVTRLGVTCDTMNQMIGSYPPRAEPYEFALPVGEWPSGMLGRGTYHAKTKISDDDGQVHAQVSWSFDVKSKWPDEP